MINRVLNRLGPLLVILLLSAAVFADERSKIIELEQRIEESVLSGNVRYLKWVYSADFRFTHIDGGVQNRAEWLEVVAKREIRSRKITTTEVELHGDVAITYGRLDTVWKGEGGAADEVLALRYVRVYRLTKGSWVMLSHRSVGKAD